MLRYGLSTLIGLVSFAAMAAVLIITFIKPPESADPFAAYDALAPGQPVAALSAFPCRYTALPGDILEDVVYCQIRPKDGPIVLVGVLAQDDTIRGLSFSLRGMQMGHLARRWGHPDTVESADSYTITRWSEGVQATARTFGWFTYEAVVDYVFVRAELLPQDSGDI